MEELEETEPDSYNIIMTGDFGVFYCLIETLSKAGMSSKLPYSKCLPIAVSGIEASHFPTHYMEGKLPLMNESGNHPLFSN